MNAYVFVVTTPEGKTHIRTTRRGPEEGGPGFTITKASMNWKAARAIYEIYEREHDK